MNHNIINGFPILSFYSGGGFMDMGFEMAGFEIVWSNEYDKTFAELHASGITSWRKSQGNGVKAEIFNTKSIVEISSSEILSEAFPNGKPLTFGIIGGPPCQDFSINGKLKGFNGERGKLTILFFDKILELKPTFFVMENVTGLISGEAHKEYVKTLIEKIEKHYIVDYKVLNALNYGVPQSRERVFFVGIRKECLDIKMDLPIKWFDWPINHKYNNALKKYFWPKINDFGEKLMKPKDLPIELCVESCLVSNQEINSIPNANEYFPFKTDKEKLLKIREGETNRPSFKRLHRFRYSPTTCYGNNEVHMHPYENRRISVREALRIQGAPETYVLPKDIPLSKKFKMIGNGVPVPLAKSVADSLMQFLAKNKL
ncbi:DNA cytosine methyltransferase [Emticicia agri]|uniref:DNA (cytosine-5-)-methyltransferase n=1 Tax=Emticicia agri TaxID=2492393 RepID=A0A4Q5LTB2_9BACT|nr:DNA cytosine methyltransferase [Emticicia agri]RYU92858.1 DNA cytosine methyltransferase [Emticicia agri]